MFDDFPRKSLGQTAEKDLKFISITIDETFTNITIF